MLRLSIDRGLLYETLGINGDKMPADFAGKFLQVQCLARWRQPHDTVVVVADVIVTPTVSPANGRKSSAHRIFVVCPACGQQIPFGRFHQHFGTHRCVSKSKRPDMDWTAECGIWICEECNSPFYPMEVDVVYEEDNDKEPKYTCPECLGACKLITNIKVDREVPQRSEREAGGNCP